MSRRTAFMPKNTARTWLIAVLLFVIAAALAVVYVLSVVLSDNLKFQRGDLAYQLVVTSGTIRDFPIITGNRKPVDFVYVARDGTAPGRITMTYAGGEIADALLQRFRSHCAARGYEIVPPNKFLLSSDLACDAPDYRIEIDLQLDQKNRPVTVEFLER